MLLDEVAFQHQCFQLRIHDHDLNVTDFADQAGNADAMPRTGLEVAPNSRLQRDSLAYIEDLALFAAIDVASGLCRELFQLILDMVSQGDGAFGDYDLSTSFQEPPCSFLNL